MTSALTLPLPINLRQVSRKLSLPGVCEVKITDAAVYVEAEDEEETNAW